MKITRIVLCSISVVAALYIISCKKESAPPQSTNTTPTNTVTPKPTYNKNDSAAAIDEIMCTFILNDTKVICDGAAKGQAVDRTTGLPCVHIRKIPDTLYNSAHDTCLDINLGTSDCMCLDGRTRRGEILVFWNSKSYFDTASIITLTYKNYYINDIGVTGVRTLSNVSSKQYSFNANLTITYPSGGGTATWNATRDFTLTKIASTYYYSITGSSSGTSHIADTYSSNITNPLYITFLPWFLGGCAWIESGNEDITCSGSPYPDYLNYGAIGTCLNQVTSTVNGNNYLIAMP